MDFRTTFFDPQGRMAPRPFAQAYILLTGVMVLVLVAAAVVHPQANMLQYALVFPYLCVFGKRLHDAGQTAWLWLLFLTGWLIVNAVAGGVLLQMLAPEAVPLSTEIINAVLAQPPGDQAEMAAKVAEFARLSALPNLAAYLIASALTGYVAYSLKSDPNTNRFGPPPNRAATFD